MNHFMGMGRLTRDPEVKYTPSGKTVVSFTVAIQRARTSGESSSDFIRCQAWDKTADIIAGHFSKGDGIAFEGQLMIDSYEAKDGTKKEATKINVNRCYFPPGRVFNGGDNQEYQLNPKSDPYKNTDDEDVPF
jgi:single-strand DNA-binding protein